MWKIDFSQRVLKDAKKIKSANLDSNLKDLLDILKVNPYQPPYEKLSGNLKKYYSRRINIQHRLVYSIDEENQVIKVVSIWSHINKS
ncbi:RelE/StbE replicon stabilization toxin [Geminocystis sp. NIES-3708]|nr:RelE/StbE replicon stabilization toxin [Geminocystis sp. NIES-3708]